MSVMWFDAAYKDAVHSDKTGFGSEGCTMFRMHILASEIGDYWSTNHKYPASLSLVASDPGHIPIIDCYGNPYSYKLVGDTFTLTSLGDDGKLGGVGADADIALGEDASLTDSMSVEQFFRNRYYRYIFPYIALSGIVSSAIAYLMFRNENFTRQGFKNVVYKCILTYIAVFIVTSATMFGHLPTGL